MDNAKTSDPPPGGVACYVEDRAVAQSTKFAAKFTRPFTK
jgi:hypothetical protein